MKGILVVIIVIVIFVVLAVSSKGCGEGFSKRHYPQTYYKQGGWLNSSPYPYYSPDDNYEIENYSENEPPPTGYIQPSEDLCQQCIGHCELKIWAGVTSLSPGKNEKQHCINECNLECKEYDRPPRS